MFSRNAHIWLATAFAVLAAPQLARAQFDDVKPTAGPRLDKAVVSKIKIGVSVTAAGGQCLGVVGTVPVPTEWPEQKVTILKEDVSPTAKVEYRKLPGGVVRQMLVSIRTLQAGEESHAFVTFEVAKHVILPPDDKSNYKISEHPDKDKEASLYLGPSPYIESHHPRIMKLAKEAGAGKENWDKVEAIYDAVGANLKFKEGDLKGALKGLQDGEGDCEEYSSLFIAMCRAEGIPARTVWVPHHCYSEFFMVDDKGAGHWFPCQSAGAKSFGGIDDTRPILQKGDNFHDPDRPTSRLRYVNEFLKARAVKNGGKPQVHFIQEAVN